MKVRRLHGRNDPYPVVLGRGLIDELGAQARGLASGGRVMVVTQRRLARLYGARLERGLRSAGLEVVEATIPEGERYKNLRTVSLLYDRMLACGLTRDDRLLALGGGLVGDTAGFAAATFLRGIAFAQIPTTLLAQIDSAIGAKVGVNHRKGKNLIGSIYRPRAVWIDPSLLQTLPERQFRSGMFELLKYGFIDRPKLLKRIETSVIRPGDAALDACITDAVRSKLAVVREDEGEHGRRRILNFGHTIGHGLEAASDYRLLTHGEAVGIGMIGAVRLARNRGRLKPSLADRLERAVRSVGPLPSVKKLSRARVLEAIGRDKKQGAGGLRFILPVNLGRVEIVENFPVREIEEVLTELQVGSR